MMSGPGPTSSSERDSSRSTGMRERSMAAQTEELHAMISALAGSQALLLDALRRRGSIAPTGPPLALPLAAPDASPDTAPDTAFPTRKISTYRMESRHVHGVDVD